MGFALLALKTPGMSLSKPGSVATTYPGLFDDLVALARPVSGQCVAPLVMFLTAAGVNGCR